MIKGIINYFSDYRKVIYYANKLTLGIHYSIPNCRDNINIFTKEELRSILLNYDNKLTNKRINKIVDLVIEELYKYGHTCIIRSTDYVFVRK